MIFLHFAPSVRTFPHMQHDSQQLNVALSASPIEQFSIPVGSTVADFEDSRRVPTSRRGRFTVQQVWERHKEIARLRAIGLDGKEIASNLGISEACVSYTLNSPLVQHQINLIQAGRDSDAVDVLEQMKALAPKAAALMDQVMDNIGEPTALRLRAAQQVMEYVLPKRTQVEGIHAVLSMDDIAEIKQRARQMREQQQAQQSAAIVV